MEDWKNRLVKEYKELLDKIKKLEKFLDTHSSNEIQGWDYMCMQLYAMQTYAMALKARIKLYGIEVKPE